MNKLMREIRRSGIAAVLSALMLVSPVAAEAHDDQAAHDTGQAASHAEPAAESGGGSGPFVIGGVAVGLLAVTGGLIYIRENQRRGPAQGAAPAEPRARRSW